MGVKLFHFESTSGMIGEPEFIVAANSESEARSAIEKMIAENELKSVFNKEYLKTIDGDIFPVDYDVAVFEVGAVITLRRN